MLAVQAQDAWVSALDAAALQAVTDLMRQIGGEERLFLNWALRFFVEIDLLKLGVPALAAFWVWARPQGFAADPVRTLRQIGGVMLAMAIGRGAQIVLPERPRPMQSMPDFPFPGLGHLPWIADGSSMPSDHAALAFALATVAWFGSRRLGAAAFLWAALVVCMPRLYFGYHYLSDLVGGAFIGVAAVWFAARVPLPRQAVRLTCGWARWMDARAPGLAVVCLFLIAFECLTLFQSSRKIANAGATVVAVALGKPFETVGAAALPPSAAAGERAAASATTGGDGGHAREVASKSPATD